MSSITAHVTRNEEYSIYIGQGLLTSLFTIFPESIAWDEVVIVTDAHVGDLYGNLLRDSLASCNVKSTLLTIPSGENSKSLDTFLQLIEQFARMGVKRRTPVLALGGGVVCDTVGFVASAYMRGIPYINLPTSLVAQADAAIGGKVAVNHPLGKNLIGSFYAPHAVIIDPVTLRSLSARDISAGLAEVIKIAIIASEPLFSLLEANISNLISYNINELEQVIAEAIELKVNLITRDPFEFDLRRELNFGHTLAHPIETASTYTGKYVHGEAVSIGIATATRMAVNRGLCTPENADRIFRLLMNAGLPIHLDPSLYERVMEHVEMVRRIRNGHIYFVMPRAIGQVEIYDDVCNEELLGALTR